MNRLRYSLILLALGAASAAWGQQSSSQPDTTAQPPMVEDRAQVPPVVNGTASSLEFAPETERSNYLRGGISVGADYDDNALSTTTDPISNVNYSVLPFIALDQTRSRLHWTLGYHAGLIVNQRLTERNQGTHDLDGGLEYRLSPHVTLQLRDSFVISSNFFDQLQDTARTPVAGGISQPNQFVLTPLAQRLSNLGTANLSYQFSADDMVGASGTFYDSRFRQLPAGATTLFDTSNRSASGFYNHRLTPRNWTGFTYQFQRTTFAPGTGSAETHTFMLMHTIYLQTNMTLSFFAGPERTQLELASVSAGPAQWSGMGGGSFGWQGQHTSARIDASHRVSDGGGVLTSVRLTSVDGAVRRQILKSSTVGLGVSYGDSDSIVFTGQTPSKLKSAYGSASWEQQLGAAFGFNLGYARGYQKGTGPTFTNGDVNHNRAWFTFFYNFTRPMGR